MVQLVGGLPTPCPDVNWTLFESSSISTKANLVGSRRTGNLESGLQDTACRQRRPVPRCGRGTARSQPKGHRQAQLLQLPPAVRTSAFVQGTNGRRVDRDLSMTMSFRTEIRAGDVEAFGRLFDEFARNVYNHTFRLTGNWSTAEDVLSLTFLEAWRLHAKVEPEGESLRPWLLGIATNVARNSTRAARRHAAMVARLPASIDQADFSDEIAGRLDDAQQLMAVRHALGRLRRAELEVFALCVWAGMDYATTAEVLGIPIGTVRSRLSRARKKLSDAIRDLLPAKPEPADLSGQAQGDCGSPAAPPAKEIRR